MSVRKLLPDSMFDLNASYYYINDPLGVTTVFSQNKKSTCVALFISIYTLYNNYINVAVYVLFGHKLGKISSLPKHLNNCVIKHNLKFNMRGKNCPWDRRRIFLSFHSFYIF